MPSWEWVLVALLVLGVLQVLALRNALRGDGPAVDGRGSVPYGVEPEVRGDAATADGVRRCPRCDAENRPGFSYCRNCAGHLVR